VSPLKVSCRPISTKIADVYMSYSGENGFVKFSTSSRRTEKRSSIKREPSGKRIERAVSQISVA